MSSVVKIYAMFLGSAFLLFAGGLQGLLLSVRGAEEHFSLLALGLIGTGWSVGFIAGSITSRVTTLFSTLICVGWSVVRLIVMSISVTSRPNDEELVTGTVRPFEFGSSQL